MTLKVNLLVSQDMINLLDQVVDLEQKKPAELIEKMRATSQVQQPGTITGLEAPDTPPAKPPANLGATDRTRAKFKSKYGGGNVARGSKKC